VIWEGLIGEIKTSSIANYFILFISSIDR